MNTSRRHSTWLHSAALATWLAEKKNIQKNCSYFAQVSEQDHTNNFDYGDM